MYDVMCVPYRVQRSGPCRIGDARDPASRSFLPWERALALTLLASACSPTHVPKPSAVLWQASFAGDVCALGDVNGDGCEDVVATGALEDAHAHILSGRDGSVLARLLPEAARSRGAKLAAVGDVDGDGVGDIAHCGQLTSVVTVFSGRTGEPVHGWRENDHELHFGAAIAGLGDLDGDGGAEIGIGAPRGGPGYLDVFRSSDGSRLFRVVGSAEFGCCAAPAPDCDDDGTPDFWVGARRGDAYVQLISGRDGSVIGRVDPPEDAESFGEVLRSVEDFDGDGLADLYVGGYRSMFWFSSGSFELIRSTSFTQGDGGVPLPLGDFNGDGHTDYALDRSWSWQRGINDGSGDQVVIVTHRRRGLARVPYRHAFGFRSSKPAGDLDGDGVPDVIVPAGRGMIALSGARL